MSSSSLLFKRVTQSELPRQEASRSLQSAMPSLPLLVFLIFSISTPSSLSFTPEEESQILHFRQYLQIPTAHPNPDYASAVSFLSSLARSIPGLLTRTLDFSSQPQTPKPLLLISWPGSDPSLPSILLNSHIDSVPAEPSKWLHPPFSAAYDPPSDPRIFARGAQDDKCLAIQYLEAIRSLVGSSFTPLRSVHISLVPDEEIGGGDGAAKLAASDEFRALNVGFMLDEGQASTTDEFRVFYADRLPWSLIVKAVGEPGHGSRMFDGSAMENLMLCLEAAARFRDDQFDLVKAGVRAASEVISVNPVYMKGGTPSPTGFVMNMQPSEAEVGFDVRLPPTEDPNLLRKRINEWAPSTRNMTYQFVAKGGPVTDISGRPLATATDEANPWWSVFKEAIIASGARLRKPEILGSTTDARYMRQLGIPTLGFSPMSNTPILLHDHNEFLNDTVFLRGIKIYERLISSLSTVPAIATL